MKIILMVLGDKHMGNYMERKIVFLYPKLSNLSNGEDDKTYNLLSDIQRIANAANRMIEDILCSHCFQTIKCKPNISMKLVDDNVTDFQMESNVRICISKYGSTDYTPYYSKIIDEFKKGSSDISHLVALDISPTETKINFHADSEGNFDAIVTVDLALHKILCKSKSDQAKGGLQSKHDLGFPLNCMVPVGGDGMRAEGVNTVSAHGKNIKRGNPIMRSPCPRTLSKVGWKPNPNFDRLLSNETQCFLTPNTKFCASCHRS